MSDLIWIIALVPAMAVIDYHLFREWVKCDECGARLPKYTFLMACFLEVTLFLLGYSAGVGAI